MLTDNNAILIFLGTYLTIEYEMVTKVLNETVKGQIIIRQLQKNIFRDNYGNFESATLERIDS